MAKKKRKKKPKKSSGSSRAPKVDLTMDQMLERIPEKEWITTKELQHVLNECHEITIYRQVQDGKITPYRTNSRGKANLYKRADVVDMVKARFEPKPVG